MRQRNGRETDGAEGAPSSARKGITMNKVKSKNGTDLELDKETGAYWVTTSICGKSARLFAGVERPHAEEMWKWYASAKE